MRGGLWSDARMRGLARTVGVTPSARRGDARMRGLARTVGVMEIENLFRYPVLAVGLMEIENLFRYPALAVGLKPSAIQGKARLRGLYRIISSKTISPRPGEATPACAGETGLFLQRPYALGWRGEARLRG
jgi:hypothetical protein